MKALKPASAVWADTGTETPANNAPLATATPAQTMAKLAINAGLPILSAQISAAISCATPSIAAAVLKAVPSIAPSVCRITATRRSRASVFWNARWLAAPSALATRNARPARTASR